MSRDEFPKQVIDVMGKRAAFICSNPACRRPTIAPAGDKNKFIYIGKVAHICAAAQNGPRFDSAMTELERKAITNALFLCGSCADMIDKNMGGDFSVEQLKDWKGEHEAWVAENLYKTPGGLGGEGGGGTINGNRGTIIGGRGGNGGIGGQGGKGGSGTINGDDGLIIGGDGGSCATPDGRGGRGARGPTERAGVPTQLWGYGRGGAGANTSEYNIRIEHLASIRKEYLTRFQEDALYINAGIEQVPIDWINQRLAETGKEWRVSMGPEGYVLPPLSA